eukprot:scaffold30500_cov60-Phaeocystis_antarctica.AAC.8
MLAAVAAGCVAVSRLGLGLAAAAAAASRSGSSLRRVSVANRHGIRMMTQYDCLDWKKASNFGT